MNKLTVGFEVHQPFRIRRDMFWNPIYRGYLEERFIDMKVNREIFEKVRRRCYVPATSIILEEIERGEEEGRDVKFFFSISGTFLEQAEKWGRDVIELFQQLSYTHNVEFLAQTYYHSVTSMWEDLTEWRDQVKEHAELIRSYFKQTPRTFENTELLTNNRIIDEAGKMGFNAILSEGIERELRGKNPNYVYKHKDSDVSILFRNYRLSDDIAFRFSNKAWDQYPLTADKFSSWVKSTPGQNGLIFVDYETFGEHHDQSTGILEFLRWLPSSLNREGVSMTLPKEVSKDVYDNFEFQGTTSWADIRKDESSWLGNIMQWAYDDMVRRSEMPSKELGKERLKLWKYFTTSDNYYYMFLGEGGPAEVHSYFNAFGSPIDAFINEFFAINVFLDEELHKLNVKNEPYFFTLMDKRSSVAWNQKEFMEILKREPKFKSHEANLRRWLDDAQEN